jgi:ribose transport system ATP-binding protein
VLDEPTASLAASEAALLFDAVRRLAAEGVAVVYISHYLAEVGDLADRVLVLRNGRTAGEVSLRSGSGGDDGERVAGDERDALLDRVVELMVGHQVAGLGEREQRRPDGEPLLSVDGLTAPGAFTGLSLRVLPGEVVGVTGLIGSGVEALADAVTTGGTARGAAGRVGLGGRRVRSRRSFVRAGGAHVPAQRRRDGIVVRATVRENIGLVATGEVSRWGLLLPRRERAVAERWVERTDVRPADPEALTGSLSGGNQQKVVLAKWLARGSRLFVLDQPTAGVDVASREQLYARIEEQVDAGAGVLLITTDLEELVGLADRVLVLHRGVQVAALARAELGVERLLAISSGQRSSDRRDQQQEVPA